MPADRPLERRAAARTAVVWEAIQPILAATPDQAVVDIGGGTGGFAVRIAQAGHRVTVIDPSPDALAAAGRRAEESGVSARVVQGELADLPALVGNGGTDLVLCHGVLGIVDDPGGALSTIARVLRPGGSLSLLVGQHHAAVIHRAMSGHLAEARELLEGTRETGPGSGERRFTADECRALASAAGLTVAEVHAVRVFADLVPSSVVEMEPGAVDALLALERAVAARPEYQILGAQLHVVARR